ncbi:GNAT family N-acetyltransferase [Vibrio sp. DW001]|uniref:GNAT family N-acetyltransferase n=1 Tax=Vibrio sp. DW001 TaxID=2912315 RepID=UPI0023B17A65|nr:GNAT family N-acetyltransferase [Vibrio sp. DW001]WED27656.1 GNAT family N-acetyltransferase [Vibrio sp. DW001]
MMKLIQLNRFQIESLSQHATNSRDVIFVEGSVPPIHVLNRSLYLCHNAAEELWALPYFMQKASHIIGCCGFKGVPKNTRIEIGYNVAPDARGLGAATFAVQQLSQIAFDSGLVKTVVALISSDNKASLSVVRKNGFSYKELIIDEEGEELELWQLDIMLEA